jgi:hypothetical protein
MKADDDELEHEPGDGILVNGSPFREILVRATALKKAGEQVLDGVSPVEDADHMLVPSPAIDQLREALSGWKSPISRRDRSGSAP